jgi:hypothetical protein
MSSRASTSVTARPPFQIPRSDTSTSGSVVVVVAGAIVVVVAGSVVVVVSGAIVVVVAGSVVVVVVDARGSSSGPSSPDEHADNNAATTASTGNARVVRDILASQGRKTAERHLSNTPSVAAVRTVA